MQNISQSFKYLRRPVSIAECEIKNKHGGSVDMKQTLILKQYRQGSKGCGLLISKADISMLLGH